MSSHTCSDIYNVHLTTFSSLLFFCDELQEWGRKTWNSIYAGLQPEAIDLTIEDFTKDVIDVHEKICMSLISDEDIIIRNIVQIFTEQYSKYKLVFRDGQYTKSRTFGFTKKISILLYTPGTDVSTIEVEFAMKADEENYFQVDLSKATSMTDAFYKNIKKELDKSFYKKDVKYIQ
jgi:hypothetical protein